MEDFVKPTKIDITPLSIPEKNQKNNQNTLDGIFGF
jgi:hypothetical protein